MPKNWKTYILDNLIVSKNQGVNTTTEKVKYSNTGDLVVRAKNVRDYKIDYEDITYVDEQTYNNIRIQCKPLQGDILYTNIGSQMGSAAQVATTNRFVIAWNVLRLIPNTEKIDSNFLVYLLNEANNKTYIRNLNSSSTMPFVSGKALGKVKFHLPPLPEQTAIASILSTIDAKIENNLAINKTLEEMAMALYKEWFVDFGPFQDGKFVDSELGMMPEGWEVKSIGETIETVGGGTPRTKTLEYWEDGDVLWYSPTDLTREKSMFSSDSSKKITQLGLQKSSAKIFPPYSLLMSSRATIGLLTINTKQASTNQGFITMIPNDTLKIYQLYNWIKFNLDLIISKSNGSTFKEISKTNFRNLKIVVGQNIDNYEIQSKSIFERIESNINQNQTLTTLRDTLLPKLISGEVRLNEFASN